MASFFRLKNVCWDLKKIIKLFFEFLVAFVAAVAVVVAVAVAVAVAHFKPGFSNRDMQKNVGKKEN